MAEPENDDWNGNLDRFIAFSARLSALLDQKLQSTPVSVRDSLPMLRNHHRTLLDQRAISNIIELSPFFHFLSAMNVCEESVVSTSNAIESSILEDFLESWI